MRNVFLQKICRKRGRGTSSGPLFFEKRYTRSKQVVKTLVLIYFGRPLLGHAIEKLYNVSDCWYSDFLWKSLGLAFLPHFCIIFQEKYFSCCILLTDQISLSGCLYFLRYWAICVLQFICFPVCDLTNSEINLSFLTKSFPYMTKNVATKL